MHPQDAYWIIVSNKLGRGRPYWRPGNRGYTETIVDAGNYSAEEAQSIVAGSHDEDLAFSLFDDALLEVIKEDSLVRANELLLWRKLAASAALPTVPAAAGVAQSGWVSCADRLPENRQPVIVWGKPGWYMMAVARVGQDGSDAGHLWEEYGTGKKLWGEITHWSELTITPPADAAR